MIYLLIYVAVICISPYISINYFNNKDFSFKENEGYLCLYRYDDTTFDMNQDVQLEYEVMMSSDMVSINDKNYRTVFSDADIFKIGMPSKKYSKTSDFYAFEFIYGTAFTNDLEIVISESISNELFNKTNSVGETITFMGETFTVSGVVTEPEEMMAYIYFTNEHIAIDPEHDDVMYQNMLFQDRHLPLKLYEKGGLYLISNTVTKYNHFDIRNDFLFINSIGFLLIISMEAVIDSFRRKAVEDDSKVKNHEPHYFKIVIDFFIWATLVSGFFIIPIIGFYANFSSFRVAWMITRDGIVNHLWIFSIYVIPFIYAAIKMHIYKLKNNTQNSI